MRNSDIIYLQLNGLQAVTAHTLQAADAYKTFKLKKAVDNAFNAIVEAEKRLMAEHGIERGKQPKDEAAAERYIGERNALLEDDTPLDGVRTVSYRTWLALQRENREKVSPDADDGGSRTLDLLAGKTEMILENVFWTAPQEEE